VANHKAVPDIYLKKAAPKSLHSRWVAALFFLCCKSQVVSDDTSIDQQVQAKQKNIKTQKQTVAEKLKA